MKKPTEQTPYVFVYGTLMSGLSNNGLLRRSAFISTATTEESYKLISRGIPFLIEEEGKTYVTGEIYEVTEHALKNLDALEGHPNWYERKIINVVDELGDRVKAWVYFMPANRKESGELVESGNYRDYVESMVSY
jgi:gamma-glutamylaminecyclotransferase